MEKLLYVSVFAYCVYWDTTHATYLHTLTSLSAPAQMGPDVQADGKKRKRVHPAQIVLYLFLEWHDQPSCHLLSLDWLRSLPVVEALHTKPALISRPRGVLALEF